MKNDIKDVLETISDDIEVNNSIIAWSFSFILLVVKIVYELARKTILTFDKNHPRDDCLSTR